MTPVQFVNVHGAPVSTAAVPVKRAKREASEKFHKGFSVQGVPPGAVEEAETAHRKEVEDIQRHNALGGEQFRLPPPWDAERWLNKARRKKVRSKPYEVPQAAEECKAMAEIAGWRRVVVVEIFKDAAE